MTPIIRLLYTEDNPQDADRARIHFADHAADFVLETVGTGRACLDRLHDGGVDLVLLDHRLPDMDGLDVLKAMSREGFRVPVVMVTGSGDEDLVVRALRLGASNYVPKSGEYLDTLPDILRSVMEEYRRTAGAMTAGASVRRILYVEHLPMDIELTIRYFAEIAPSFAVEVVESCREALTKLEVADAYDLVLIDLRMPDQSALEFIREARRRHLAVPPFIVISGKGDDAAAIATLRMGAADYIAKRDGYLHQLVPTIERTIAVGRLGRLNDALQGELAERRAAEARLQTSEARYRQLFASNPHPMWVYDLASLRFLAVNDAAVVHYGYGRDDFLSMTIEDIRPAEELPRLRAQMARSPEHGVQASGLWTHRRRDGSVIDVDITSHGFDFDGRPARLVLAHDVTERLRAERALRESEERFRATFEQAAVGIAHVAPDGRWLRVNQKLCDIVGYEREELLALSFQDITYVDDVPLDIENARQLLDGSVTTYTREKRYVRKNGSPVWINLTVSLVRMASGEPSYLISVVEDISRRKHAEELLRLQSAGLNASADAMIITDREGVIQWANPAFAALTGYGAEEAIGQNPRNLVKSGVHDRATYRRLWETILAGEVWRGELTNRRKDGSLYPEEQSVTPVTDGKGTITHFIAVKRDLTSQKALEAQFLQSQKMESVGRLAGGVAHDFNNMLTVVNGYVEMALDRLMADSDVREYLEEVKSAASRSAALVQQLLAFARKQAIAPQVVDPNDALAGMLKMLGRLIGEDIELVWRPGHDVGAVFLDPGQLHQIVVNLAVNARHAIGTVGRLTIETRRVEFTESDSAAHGGVAPGVFAEVSVTDTGCGMDEATRARIFEPFFTTKPVGEGTGLGLATVYGIVRQNHGTVSVDSELGRGTVFRVYLPRHASGTTAGSREQAAAPPRGTETILAVEDEPSVLALTRRLLESLGYHVLVASGPSQAVELAAERGNTIDLLITDVIMPGMTGRALWDVVSRMNPALKCLFVSGYTADSMGHQGVLDVDLHLLQKPFDLTTLAVKVRETLSGPPADSHAAND
jgi:PAS domain S-box-containing protein